MRGSGMGTRGRAIVARRGRGFGGGRGRGHVAGSNRHEEVAGRPPADERATKRKSTDGLVNPRKVREGDALEVEVEEGGSTAWVTAQVVEVRRDGRFCACINHDPDFIEEYELGDEGIEWRRVQGPRSSAVSGGLPGTTAASSTRTSTSPAATASTRHAPSLLPSFLPSFLTYLLTYSLRHAPSFETSPGALLSREEVAEAVAEAAVTAERLRREEALASDKRRVAEDIRAQHAAARLLTLSGTLASDEEAMAYGDDLRTVGAIYTCTRTYTLASHRLALTGRTHIHVSRHMHTYMCARMYISHVQVGSIVWLSQDARIAEEWARDEWQLADHRVQIQTVHESAGTLRLTIARVSVLSMHASMHPPCMHPP